MNKETIYQSMYPSPEQSMQLRDLGFDQTLAPVFWVWLEAGCWGGWALWLTRDKPDAPCIIYAEPGAKQILKEHPEDAGRFVTQSCCAYDLPALLGLLDDYVLDFEVDPEHPGQIRFPYNRVSFPYTSFVHGCAELLISLVEQEQTSAELCNQRLIPYRKG